MRGFPSPVPLWPTVTGTSLTRPGSATAPGGSCTGDRAAFFSYTSDNKTQTLYSIDGATAKLSTVDFLRDSAWVGGSDGHYLSAIGCSHTLFPGQTAADLRQAIESGISGAQAGRHPSLRELGARAIARQSWRALWATPRQVVGRPLVEAARRARTAAGGRSRA